MSSSAKPARLLGHRPGLLIGFGALIAALLGAFAYVVVDSQQQSRQQSEQRFDAVASLAAQLTSSLLTTSATGSEAAAVKAFGGAVIGQHAVDALAQRSGLRYVQILDQRGRVIASSSGAPATAGAKESAAQEHIQAALKGKATVSDVLRAGKPGGNVLEWAVPFETAFGRRVEVGGLDLTLVSRFLSSYLAETRSAGHGVAFALDSRGRIVGEAGAAKNVKPGGFPLSAGLLATLAVKPHGKFNYNGGERYFASSAVQGSTWRVVLGVRTSTLYPALAGSKSWFLFAVLGAFALAGAASLVFFRHALRRGVELASTNAELTAVNTTLEERVAERTAAAEDRARELARSNDELEQFSSVASHDLQEPLRKIRMFGDRLRERLGDKLAEEPAADLARMANAAERMQRLINDLLDYSRVTHRGRRFERVNLDTITKEVVADLEARVLELDAQIEVSDLPTIEADRTQMRQLIQNLVGNALKFNRDGEPALVRIRGELIDGQRPRFPGEAAAGEHCVITFEDNGIGFDERHSERIFTAFERLQSRSSYEGTGIGLSIARKIVWRHGGHITAKGVPDQGATFTVTLPLSQSNGHANGHDGGQTQ